MSTCSSPGEDCCKIELCGSLHQLEEHAQCLVKLIAFRCAKTLELLYSVLMDCVTRGFYSFRKLSEIKFDDSSVVQLLPLGIGHSSLPAGMQGKRDGIPPDVAPQR